MAQDGASNPTNSSVLNRDGSSTAAKQVASPMGTARGEPNSESDDSTERWYLRIDGQEYGPITRSQMEFFLQPPRLCSLLQVMCTVQEGIWHSIARHETIDKVLSRFGIEASPVKSSTATVTLLSQTSTNFLGAITDNLRDQFEGVVAFFTKYRIESIAVFAFLTVNAAIWIAFAGTAARDKEILKRYESIWKAAQEFNFKKTTTDEWRTFADASISEIEPIVMELQRTANVHKPVRQNLLFAGREILLTALKASDPPDPNSIDIRLFEKRLNRVRELLTQD